jgi:hypothetical protein
MKLRITARAASCMLTLGLAAGLAPVAAQAQTASDKWQWEAAIYGWFPAIGGSTSFPSNGSSGPNIDVSAQDVINALKMVFMGQIEARKGKWGVWTDVVYADLGGSKDGTRSLTVDGQPVTVDGHLGLDVKSTVWTLSGLYNLTATPENTTDLLLGARMLDMKQTLNWSLSAGVPGYPTIGHSGQASVSGTDWDAIVGVKGRYYFGAEHKWFLPYYADVGAGQSKLTWQVNAGVGYKFDWGSVFATYRYLDYQFKSGNALQSMTMNGALLGVAFQF